MKRSNQINKAVVSLLLCIALIFAFAPMGAMAKKSENSRRDTMTIFEVRRDTVKKEVVTYHDVREDGETDIRFHFVIDQYNFEPNFSGNDVMLKKLDSVMFKQNVNHQLDSMVIRATASLDGPMKRNIFLADNRAKTVKRVMIDRYKMFDSTKFFSRTVAEDWNEFREKVLADDKVPHRDEVLKIIDDTRHGFDAREWLLRKLRGGESWRYMAVHIYPKLRYGASVMLYYNVDSIKYVSYEDVIVLDTMYFPQPHTPKGFAVKTNLLYDAVTALNIEVEVPIKERFSVAGEWIFPWWHSRSTESSSKRRYFQMLNGNLEAKYWLGDRTDRPQLTGWFVGLYGGGGYYDFEHKYKGYQGDFWHAGVSAGFAHTIFNNDNWRMEYSIGLGYLNSDYTYYEDHYGFPLEWHPLVKKYETLNWFGPTKAKISLVKFINYNKNKK